MISAGGSCSILFCWPWWPLWLVLIEAGSHWPTIWQAALAGSQSPTIWQAALVAKKWKRIWVHPVSEVWICWRPLFLKSLGRKCSVMSVACCASAAGKILTKLLVVSAWFHVAWFMFDRFFLPRFWLVSDSCCLMSFCKVLHRFSLVSEVSEWSFDWIWSSHWHDSAAFPSSQCILLSIDSMVSASLWYQWLDLNCFTLWHFAMGSGEVSEVSHPDSPGGWFWWQLILVQDLLQNLVEDIASEELCFCLLYILLILVNCGLTSVDT